MSSQKLLLTLSLELLERIDESVTYHGFDCRSEFIRHCLREQMTIMDAKPKRVKPIISEHVSPVRDKGLANEIPHLRTVPQSSGEFANRHVQSGTTGFKVNGYAAPACGS